MVAKDEALVATGYLLRNEAVFPVKSNSGADDLQLIAGSEAEFLSLQDARRTEMDLEHFVSGLEHQVKAELVLTHRAVEFVHGRHNSFTVTSLAAL